MNMFQEYESLYELPMKFGSVNGYFVCCDNFLTSLADCPKSVSGYFNCSHNIWTPASAQAAPDVVGYTIGGNMIIADVTG